MAKQEPNKKNRPTAEDLAWSRKGQNGNQDRYGRTVERPNDYKSIKPAKK